MSSESSSEPKIDNNNGPKTEDIIEFYKISVELHNAESQRYWDRNNVYILLSGGLLVLLGIDIIEGKIDGLIICGIGFFTSYMWILILRQGKDLIERWRLVVHKFEDDYKEIVDVFHTADGFSNEGKPLSILPFSKLLPSGIMRWSVILVCVAWLSAFLGILLFSNGG